MYQILKILTIGNPNNLGITPNQHPHTFFGGMILENVQYRFENLPNNYIVLLSIFLQYIIGLKEINDKGYIHKDIKPDNLMYNYENEEYTAKIIDLGTVYNIITETESFTTASQGWMSGKDFLILQALTETPPLYQQEPTPKKIK